MNNKYLETKRQIDKLLGKAENEALAEGVNISSKEFQLLLEKIKINILTEKGISLEEYENAEQEPASPARKLQVSLEDTETKDARDKELLEAIKNIKIETKVNVEPPRIPEIKVPPIEIPEIIVPEPKVTVNVPEVKMPEQKIVIPEINIKGLEKQIYSLSEEIKKSFSKEQPDGQSQKSPLEVVLIDPEKGSRYKAEMTAVSHGGGGGSSHVKVYKADGTVIDPAKEDGNLAAIKTSTELIDDAIYADDANWIHTVSKHILTGGLYQSTPQSVTDGDVAPFQADSHGNIKSVITDGTDTALVDGSGNLMVSLGTEIAGEDVTNDVLKVEHQYSITYRAAVGANVVIKASAGFLHAIILGKWVTGGTVEVSNHASDGDGAVKVFLQSGATDESGFPKTIIVDAEFDTGITADLIGTTNVSFIWR